MAPKQKSQKSAAQKSKKSEVSKTTTIVETASGSFVHKNPVLLIFNDGQAAKIDVKKKNKLNDLIDEYLKTKDKKTLKELDAMARDKITSETKGQKKGYVGLLKMHPDPKPVAVFELSTLNEKAVKTWINDTKWLKKEKINSSKKIQLKDIEQLSDSMGKSDVGSKSIRDIVRGKTARDEVKATRMYKHMKTPIFLMFSDGECIKCHLNTKNVPNEFSNMLMMADYYAHQENDHEKEKEVLKMINDAADKNKGTKHDVKAKVIPKKQRKDYQFQAGGHSVGLIRHEDDPHGANKGICERWTSGKLKLSHVMCLVDFDHTQSADRLKALLIEQRLMRAQKQNEELCSVLNRKNNELDEMREINETKQSIVKETVIEYDSSEERELNNRLLAAQRRENELRQKVEELERREALSRVSKIPPPSPRRRGNFNVRPRVTSRVSEVQTTQISKADSKLQARPDKWDPIPISSSSGGVSDLQSKNKKSRENSTVLGIGMSSPKKSALSSTSRKYSTPESYTAPPQHSSRRRIFFASPTPSQKHSAGSDYMTSRRPPSCGGMDDGINGGIAGERKDKMSYSSPPRDYLGSGYSLWRTRENKKNYSSSKRESREIITTTDRTTNDDRDSNFTSSFNPKRPYSSRHPSFMESRKKHVASTGS